MKVSGLHGLDLSPSEARRLQEELASRVVAGPALDLSGVRYVAGADVSTQGDMAYATVVVLDFPGLSPVEVRGFEAPLGSLTFPGCCLFGSCLPSLARWRNATSAPSTGARAKAEGYVLPSRDPQEDRGDARARRHGRPHAGRPPPGPRLDWYEDLFARTTRATKIHLHALSPPEIQHISRRSKLTSQRRSRGCATRASTRSPAAAARCSSTACARSSRPRRRRPPTGSASCARRTAWACRRPRR